MPFIGRTPTPVPLTSSDIPDSIITDAKIVGWFKSAMAYDDRDKMLNHYAAQLLEGRTSDNPAP